MYNVPYNQGYPQAGQPYQPPQQQPQIDPRMAAGMRIVQVCQQMQAAKDPAQFLENVIAQSPQAAQITQLIKGKNSRQLWQVARNLAHERGYDLDGICVQAGIRIPH